MPLSNKLVSEFVKATKNDTSNNKKEKTVYGKIVDKDGEFYARIDGAEENVLIPISHFTSKVNHGEKVIIMIKDHAAIVTGNVDNPSTDTTQVNEIVGEAVSEIDFSPIDIEDIEALWETNE